MKRFLMTVGAGVLVTGIVSACGSSSATSDSVVGDPGKGNATGAASDKADLTASPSPSVSKEASSGTQTSKSGPASTAATPQRIGYRDYLVGSAAAADAQCNEPAGQRTGGWFCPGEVVGRGKQIGSTEFCINLGCYWRFDDFHSVFKSHKWSWGYGKTTLGQMDFYINIQQQGAEAVAKPVRYENSGATDDVTFEGELLNAAPGAAGTPVEGTYAHHDAGHVPAGGSAQWQPNGYKNYNNTMWDHSTVGQVTWKKSGYPGRWFFYVKSISSHADKLGSGATYRLRPAHQLPAQAEGAGYRNS